MKVLVTGAAGFIGHALSRSLLARGDVVIGIDNVNDYYQTSLKDARLADLRSAGGNRFGFHKQDFSDWAGLNKAFDGVEFDRIVHLGAQAGVRYSIENPHAYVQSNLSGHVNLLELARHRAVEHMVYASSSSVYGGNTKLPFAVEDRADHPVSLYAATKKADELMSETYAHLYRIPLTGLRFFTVYGPWGRPDMAIWKFTANILAGKPIPVFNHGDMYRDFTFIDDIIAGVIACLDSAPADDGSEKAGGSVKPHALYNIGNHKSEPLMKVIGLLEEACGRKAELDLLPMQPGDVHKTYADIEAIRRDLGYEPTTSIEVGVPKFVEWFREYHAEPKPAVLKIVDGPWSKMDQQPRQPVPALSKGMIPDVPGVYALYRSGQRVYVGKASSLRKRIWNNHCGKGMVMTGSALRRNIAEHLGIASASQIKTRAHMPSEDEVTKVRDWLEGCAFAWIECETEAEALGLEVRLKTEDKPALTKI